MITFYASLFGSGDPAELLTILAASALKGLLVLGIAAGICVLLRRASASLKHLCWSVALTSLLIIPALSLLLPGLSIRILPAQTSSDIAWSVAKPAVAPSATEAASAREPASATGPASATEPSSATEPRSGIEPALATAPSSGTEPAVATERASIRSAAPVAEPVELSPGAWMLIVWVAGAGIIVLHMLIGMIAAWIVIRRARPIADPAWLNLADDVADRLLLRRRVRLLVTRSIDVPMTWGVVHPVVLLPESSREWSSEKRYCVLAHEMSHVKRLDCLTQTIATAACAVHWFNPLAWKAAASMRLEREKACDDSVLVNARARASAYASHLLDIARSIPDTFVAPVGAVTMARRSQLEGRLLSILDEERRRDLRRPIAIAAVFLGGLAILPLAAMRPTPAEQAEFLGSEAASALPASAERPEPVLFLANKAPVKAGTATMADSAPLKSASLKDVIKRSFNVSPGGLLRLDTDRGNIEVNSGAGNSVQVEVHRRVRGSADEEDFQVEFQQDGNTVEIVGEGPRNNGWGGNGVEVQFVITVPTRFNLDLDTAGGNISVDDLEGTADVSTSGGNLSFGQITGEINAETSGGNISVKGSSGNVDVNTSGGNISLGAVNGNVDAKTSGGNISVDEVHGDIEAETSGGQVNARLSKQPEGDCVLKTSGGSITVYLADDIHVDLDAETSAGYVETDLEVLTKGSLRKGRLSGTINGGGPDLILDTSAGDIHIRRL